MGVLGRAVSVVELVEKEEFVDDSFPPYEDHVVKVKVEEEFVVI